jgi:protein TonB
MNSTDLSIATTVLDGTTNRSLRVRLIGAACAVLIQIALLSLFMIGQRVSLSTDMDAGIGGSGSEISVSLFETSKTVTPSKPATAQSHGPATIKPALILPLPASAIPAGTSVSSADGDDAPPDVALAGSAGGSPAAASFQRQLLAHIEKYRRFPDEARRDRQEGTVDVLFAMDRNGLVLGIWIKRSSGYPALDKEAVATVLRAQPLPAIPSELPEPLNITLPIDYGLTQ